jgi:hypothetical protein
MLNLVQYPFFFNVFWIPASAGMTRKDTFETAPMGKCKIFVGLSQNKKIIHFWHTSEGWSRSEAETSEAHPSYFNHLLIPDQVRDDRKRDF